MEIMEAARADKGPFCLTLGEGESRAVLLVAPVEGVEGTSEAPATKYRKAIAYKVKRDDYVLLTANGPRRVSFITEESASNKDQYDAERSKKERNEEQRLRRIIDEAIQKGQPNLPDSYFQEYRDADRKAVEFTLNIESPDKNPKNKIRRNTRRMTDEYDVWEGTSNAGIVTDENVVRQALQNSLQKVQAPLNAQLASARSQIKVASSIRDGLK